MTSIVVVGSVNADLVARVPTHPAPGETVLADSMTVLPGGKGANQAVVAARLGGDVALVGAVGTDAFAAAALPGLRRAGVDLTAVATVPGPTGVALVSVDDDGENVIVVVPGANGSVDAAAVQRHARLVAGAAVVVVQGEIPTAGTEAAARAATGRVLLNLAPVVPVVREVLALADPLVVNAGEAWRLLTEAGRAVPEGEPFGVVERLRELGPRSVVLTLGGAGAVALDGDDDAGPVVVPAPTVDVVDTTGAGDAFVGALAWRLAQGDGLADAVRTAVRVGAFSVTTHGAQPSFPTADDELPV
ncbi:ribokinase [Isoptericola sp. CG 20/1183]|uniref:Ribokinase n=1 Tax=Isoptericola halotolerans TaxID=300560 RepID=A0ABX5EHR3_9MICO|nr:MULTISPECIES: ribokinase [Isoptericola]MCK0118528.1 ribokinase [Isoptericola sp. S6320L]PRZ04160.1 ribokinase [Isoptericola sp. CG 20/1183]PRZ10015.1 ribokinase [Isoptericola halotolerans]